MTREELLEKREAALERIGHLTSRCIHCGTIYDESAVDMSDYVPPVGNGCEICDPDTVELIL